MPGPANSKGRKKRQSKKEKNSRKKELQELNANLPLPLGDHAQNTSASTPPKPSIDASSEPYRVAYQADQDYNVYNERATYVHYTEDRYEEEEWQQEGYEPEPQYVEEELPFIYDPGNGPRVRDFLAFLKSPFAASQTIPFDQLGRDDGLGEIDDDLSAARVIPLLRRVLPDEFAAILWYNRTRSTHRLCPACRRIYHMGESLKAHVDGLDANSPHSDHSPTIAEQYLSGTCSVPCFALSTYNYGPAAVLAYGLVWHQLDPGTREALEGKGAGIDDQGLSLYIRISRCDGAGLRELIEAL